MIPARPRGRWRFAVVVLSAAAVLAATVLYLAAGGRAPGPSADDEPAIPVAPSGPATPTSNARSGASPTPPVTSTDDLADARRETAAIAFARRTAGLLFDWNATTTTRDEVVASLLAIADPAGQETPGLLTDIDAWLPDSTWWTQLAEYRTVQRLDVGTVKIPAAWTQAVSAGRTELPPGTFPVTVTGMRHRTGTVGGRAESFEDRVTLTMIVACPADTSCALLRLGAPDAVLE